MTLPPHVGSVTFCATDAVTGTEIVLVDASQIATGAEMIELDSSSEASVQMADAASTDSPPTTSTVFQSLWATGCVGLRAQRLFGVTRLRSAAVAVIA
jgi:hypothetical protein